MSTELCQLQLDNSSLIYVLATPEQTRIQGKRSGIFYMTTNLLQLLFLHCYGPTSYVEKPCMVHISNFSYFLYANQICNIFVLTLIIVICIASVGLSVNAPNEYSNYDNKHVSQIYIYIYVRIKLWALFSTRHELTKLCRVLIFVPAIFWINELTSLKLINNNWPRFFPPSRRGSHAQGILTIFTELTIEMNSVGPVMASQKARHCNDFALH